MKRALIPFLILCAALVSPRLGGQPADRIYTLEELRWPQIDALDRERTMFILTVGMLEEHGPHLPIGADTIGVTFEAAGVARRVAAALPEWTVVMMPPLGYGNSGANRLGGQLVHPGTYGIRQSTLRAIVADIGAEIALNRFTWTFVLNGHGAPSHGIAINEACDFVSETFGVTMLHVSGLFGADETIQRRGHAIAARHFSPQEVESFGLDVHAGVSETSGVLSLRPDLVHDSYQSLPSMSGDTIKELRAIARRPGWQGYLSSPAKATAAYGRDVEQWWIDGLSDLVLRAIRGQELRKAPRIHDRIDPDVAPVVDDALANERAFELKLQKWLDTRRPK